MTETRANTPSDRQVWSRALPIFVNYAIVALMMTCAVGVVVGVIQALSSSWNGAYLIVVCFIVAFEALYTARVMRRIAFPSREWASYRVGEVVSIMILLKALIYVMRGAGQFLIDLPKWQHDFLVSFFTGEYLLACVLVLVVYLVCNQFANDLFELESDDATLERERKNDFRNNRAASHKQLTLKVVLVAGVMIAVTLMGRTFQRIIGGGAAAASIDQEGMPSYALGLLAYVVLGFLLLSLTRLAALRAAWYRERAPISPDIAWRWALYVVVFLVVIALVAMVLPTHYSVGLLQLLRYAAGLLISLLQIVIYFLLLILTFPLNLLMRLLGNSPVTPNRPPPVMMMPPPASPDQPTGANPLLDLIQSILFWAIFLFVVGYALSQYLKRHSALLASMRGIPLLNWLMKAVSVLGDWLSRLSGQVTAMVDAGLKRLRAQAELQARMVSPARRLNLRRLSPRERVQYFYLAMARRGSESGLGRKPAQTPREYAATLDSATPEVNNEIDALTDAFIEARYSRHDITPIHAQTAQSYWERVKSALRKKKSAV